MHSIAKKKYSPILSHWWNAQSAHITSFMAVTNTTRPVAAGWLPPLVATGHPHYADECLTPTREGNWCRRLVGDKEGLEGEG